MGYKKVATGVLSKEEKERAVAIAKEIKDKTADPKDAVKRIDEALKKEAEGETAKDENFQSGDINTILGIIEDYDTDCTIEEPRVVADDEEDDDAEERSLWGDGEPEPGEADDE